MKWLFLLVLIAAALTGCSGGAGADSGAQAQTIPVVAETGFDCGQATPPSLEELMGHYVVRSAGKYRGGLTTREQAEGRVGDGVTVTAGFFSIDDRESHQPRYSIECLDVSHAEGEVPTARQRLLGPFHGYGTERAVVWELTVEAGDPGVPIAAFEVVPHPDGLELWRLYDGWIYVLERARRAQ